MRAAISLYENTYASPTSMGAIDTLYHAVYSPSFIYLFLFFVYPFVCVPNTNVPEFAQINSHGKVASVPNRNKEMAGKLL